MRSMNHGRIARTILQGKVDITKRRETTRTTRTPWMNAMEAITVISLNRVTELDQNRGRRRKLPHTVGAYVRLIRLNKR